ncbi:MAG TPA: hypothetical protein VGA99_16270, partial [bacterium]
KLAWLPERERLYWQEMIAEPAAANSGIEFLALSLDEAGQPIAVVNTDPAMWLFLENFTREILDGQRSPDEVLKLVRMCVTPYPIGLFLEGVGPVVANDVYAPSQVWESFQRDLYHSPRTVWGREVNLLILGLARQIFAADDAEGQIKMMGLTSYVQELHAALDKIQGAVESSGLKHNELWSYEIIDGKLLPARYPTSSDIQLWNLTDLVVQYLTERLADH